MTTQYPTVTRAPRMTDEDGVRFGLATGALVLALCAASAAGLGRADAAAVLLLVAGLGAAALRGRFAPLLGIIAWAFWTGFVENRSGRLTLADPDLVRLLAFAATAGLLGALVRTASPGARRG